MQFDIAQGARAQTASVAKAEGLKRLPIHMTQRRFVTLCEKRSGAADKTAAIVTTNSDEILMKFGQSSIPTATFRAKRRFWAPAPVFAC